MVTDSTTNTTVKVSGFSSPATVTGLNATDNYTFSVYATNAKGNSATSAPVQAAPMAPTSVTESNVGDGSSVITWTPSNITLGNPVTGYAVTTMDLTTSFAGPSTTVDSSTTSVTLSGFTLGDTVNVCVGALNVLSTTQSTCSSFTAYAAPAAPTGVTPVGNGDGTGSVSWTPAADVIGNPVTGYQVQLTDATAGTPTVTTAVGSATTTAPLTLTVGDSYTVCVGSTSANATLVQGSCQVFSA